MFRGIEVKVTGSFQRLAVFLALVIKCGHQLDVRITRPRVALPFRKRVEIGRQSDEVMVGDGPYVGKPSVGLTDQAGATVELVGHFGMKHPANVSVVAATVLGVDGSRAAFELLDRTEFVE